MRRVLRRRRERRLLLLRRRCLPAELRGRRRVLFCQNLLVHKRRREMRSLMRRLRKEMSPRSQRRLGGGGIVRDGKRRNILRLQALRNKGLLKMGVLKMRQRLQEGA